LSQSCCSDGGVGESGREQGNLEDERGVRKRMKEEQDKRYEKTNDAKNDAWKKEGRKSNILNKKRR
jgi:hypothetical protein